MTICNRHDAQRRPCGLPYGHCGHCQADTPWQKPNPGEERWENVVHVTDYEVGGAFFGGEIVEIDRLKHRLKVRF